MNKKRFALLLLVVMFIGLLPACAPQSPPQPQPSPVETHVQVLPGVSNPGQQPGGQPYPPPGSPAGETYPEILDGSEITWGKAISLLNHGLVARASQTHDLQVTLGLKDGRTVKTVEPAIDAIFWEIENCGGPCGDIQLATE